MSKATPLICQILAPSGIDTFAVLRTMSAVYGAAFLKRGISPFFLDTDAPDFPARLLAAARNPRIQAFCSVGSWGIRTQIDLHGATQNLIEWSGKPFLGHHGDYPFFPAVAEKLQQDFPNRITLYNDACSPGFATSMIAARGVHDYAAQAYCDFGFDARRMERRPSRRPIPLLYVGKHFDTDDIRKLFGEEYPDLLAVYDELCGEALHDFHRPIWEICAAALAANGKPYDPTDHRIQQLLFYACQATQARRREALLQRLTRHPVHVVAACGTVPTQHPNSVVHGPKTFTEVLKLIEQSRAVVIAQPNFSHGITERTLSAMHRRAVVLSTTNAFIDANFANGSDYLRLDQEFANLDEQIASLDDADYIDAIAESAWRKVVERFSPDATVARYLDFLDIGQAGA
ncbi:MAG TPA: glycosyltransferase [Burkholderiales bacterium]